LGLFTYQVGQPVNFKLSGPTKIPEPITTHHFKKPKTESEDLWCENRLIYGALLGNTTTTILSLQHCTLTPQPTPNPIKIGAFEASSTALSIASDMDANTPVRRVHFDHAPTDPSSPLSSLPPMSSPPNYTTNTENNEENDRDKSEDEFDSNIESARLHEASLASKLQEVVRTLQRVRWTFDTFLHYWVQENDIYGNDIILEDSWKYRTAVQRQRALPKIKRLRARTCTGRG